MPDPVLRTVVVEDEPLARRSLLDILGAVDWIDVVGEAADGPTATRVLVEARPDLVMMDIDLPGYGGLSVLERLSTPPAVIFVTAYDQYAISAFELAAVDYLLKPYDRERIFSALDRARESHGASVKNGDTSAQLAPSTTQRARHALGGDVLDTLFVRDRGSIIRIPCHEIIRFEADDIYVAIIVRGRRFLVQMALADLERRLPPGMFLRIHRSHVVNLSCVVSFEAIEGGRFVARLADGTHVTASRRHARAIRELVLGDSGT
jgi:two-component system, LytTR family, response regulator